MFGIGETELFIIILFGFMVFGPDKLPGAGRTIGRALRQFRTAQEGFTKVVKTEIVDPATEMLDIDAAKPNRDRTAELEEDADIETDDGDGTAPARKETFAERKARLAAERAAAKNAVEEAAASDEAVAAEEPDAASEEASTTVGPEPAAPAEAPAPKPAPKRSAVGSKAKPTAAADLYAKPAKKRSAKAKANAGAEPAADAGAAFAPAPAETGVVAGKEDEAAE